MVRNGRKWFNFNSYNIKLEMDFKNKQKFFKKVLTGEFVYGNYDFNDYFMIIVKRED